MKATDFSAALAGHASGRFSEGFSLRRSHSRVSSSGERPWKALKSATERM
jgi:hypothetical protein